ncbi:hypothetical protein [Flavobacterium sp.]|uniref:hypothetical protein n=1 Tax=Flavobacterium sp. TaxID=239 RepID=UPI003D6C108F
MENNQNLIIVSEGKKPFWQTVIAALLFMASIVFLFNFFYDLYVSGIAAETKTTKRVIGYLKLSLFAFFGGLKFSLIKTLFIDSEREKLKTEYRVGIFKVNYYSEIPQLEYVSVFKNSQKEIFEVNLWYKGNKHFNVSNYEELQAALDFGIVFSKKLNLDLLDATEKGNSKWIEIS